MCLHNKNFPQLKELTDIDKGEIIIQLVSKYFGYTTKRLTSKRKGSQKRDKVNARNVGYKICKELTDLRNGRIGDICKRDRITVFHGVKTMERDLKLNYDNCAYHCFRGNGGPC